MIHLPESTGAVFTNSISVKTQPWLADHMVAGTVLLPGTALLELVVRPGDELGAGTVAELGIESPLVLPEKSGVQLRVTVGEPDEAGTRTVAVNSRPEQSRDLAADDVWTRHATGALSSTRHPAEARPDRWPPAGAEPVTLDGFYQAQAEAGFEVSARCSAGCTRCGSTPARCTRGRPARRRRVPESFLLHPALFDAALHAAAFLPGRGGTDAPARLPFAWTGATMITGLMAGMLSSFWRGAMVFAFVAAVLVLSRRVPAGPSGLLRRLPLFYRWALAVAGGYALGWALLATPGGSVPLNPGPGAFGAQITALVLSLAVSRLLLCDSRTRPALPSPITRRAIVLAMILATADAHAVCLDPVCCFGTNALAALAVGALGLLFAALLLLNPALALGLVEAALDLLDSAATQAGAGPLVHLIPGASPPAGNVPSAAAGQPALEPAPSSASSGAGRSPTTEPADAAAPPDGATVPSPAAAAPEGSASAMPSSSVGAGGGDDIPGWLVPLLAVPGMAWLLHKLLRHRKTASE